MNRIGGFKLFVLVIGLLVTTGSQADPFVGRFEGEIDGKTYELLIYSDASGLYDGEMRNAEERLPMFGNRYGDYLLGKIGFPENEFAFRARVMGAIMLIERQSAPPLRFFRKSE